LSEILNVIQSCSINAYIRIRWDTLVVGFVGGDGVVGAEFFLGVEAGDFAHFAAAVGAGQDFDGVAGGWKRLQYGLTAQLDERPELSIAQVESSPDQHAENGWDKE
jgi:hypothetical protein